MKQKIFSAGAALLILALLLLLSIFASDWEQAVTTDASADVKDAPPMIALTFDDGPMRATTPALLDGLAQRGVPVTFFLVGEQIVGNEDIVQRIDAEGHQIGIHTFDHVTLTGLNQSDFDAQVDKTRQLLKTVLGHNDFLLRPPYGLYDEGVQTKADCPIILWSIDPEDWGDKDIDRIAQHIVDHANDGAVILLHDIYPTSVEAALRAVDELHARGYLFVTIEQLFEDRGIELVDGMVYRNVPAQ